MRVKKSLVLYKVTVRPINIKKRRVYLQTREWPVDVDNDGYTDQVRCEVEKFWSPRLQQYLQRYHQQHHNSSDAEECAQKCYCLSMFPYPSGNLHMGHVRVYTLSNLFAQFYRMNGYRVIHPIGWDAFGLPAENAAIERGVDTATWTLTNIQSMRSQLDKLDLTLDWDREVLTSDAKYYKWTQWLFVQMFKRGLAYQANATVNWDPVDNTVLANEQVDEQGNSWRSGAKVEKRRLKQWFLGVARYSQSLLEGLGQLPLWPKHVKELQRQWIGEQIGVRFICDVIDDKNEVVDKVPIFTTDPESLVDVDCVFTHKNNFLSSSSADGWFVRNPISGAKLQIQVSQSMNYGETEVVKFGSSRGSQESSSQDKRADLEKLKTFVRSPDSFVSTSSVRDWLISRQRFWGAPIPIVHCDDCGAVPVDERDLPVVLPKREPEKKVWRCTRMCGFLRFNGSFFVENEVTYSGTSPKVLSDYTNWIKTTCPSCGKSAKRESDTMDTFVDSSWYFLRYIDPNNEMRIFDKDKQSQYLPVDLYVGGIEHARLHLLYARFVMHVLHDLKLVSYKEPFRNLLCQGLMLSRTFRLDGSGHYVSPNLVIELAGQEFVHSENGQKIVSQYEKMSKSKHNGVNPDELVQEFGSDAVKCYVLDNVNPAKEIFYNPRNLMGVIRWRNRLWLLVTKFINHRTGKSAISSKYKQSDKDISMKQLCAQRNKAAASFVHMNCFKVAELRPDKTMRQTQALTNMLKTFDAKHYSDSRYQKCLLDLMIMVSPFMPLVSMEMWSGLVDNINRDVSELYQVDKTVLEQTWPREAVHLHDVDRASDKLTAS